MRHAFIVLTPANIFNVPAWEAQFWADAHNDMLMLGNSKPDEYVICSRAHEPMLFDILAGDIDPAKE